MHNEEGERGTGNVVYHRSQQQVRPHHVEQLLQRGDRVDGTARARAARRPQGAVGRSDPAYLARFDGYSGDPPGSRRRFGHFAGPNEATAQGPNRSARDGTSLRSRATLPGLKRSCGAGYSVVHRSRARRFDGVVVGGLGLKSGDAHPENHIGMRRVAAIGRAGDLRQARSIGTVMHDPIVQSGSPGIRGGPADNRERITHGLDFRARGDLHGTLPGRSGSHLVNRKMQNEQTSHNRCRGESQNECSHEATSDSLD
jgi:hypothetical protein